MRTNSAVFFSASSQRQIETKSFSIKSFFWFCFFMSLPLAPITYTSHGGRKKRERSTGDSLLYCFVVQEVETTKMHFWTFHHVEGARHNQGCFFFSPISRVVCVCVCVTGCHLGLGSDKEIYLFVVMLNVISHCFSAPWLVFDSLFSPTSLQISSFFGTRSYWPKTQHDVSAVWPRTAVRTPWSTTPSSLA